ncbi:hypothetical protein [Methanobacterium oryzae]|uniref:hypothetical protein n=1 Tax=Methanobacterium oryzae TaxID=69540 RepID=UPI003D1EA904
MALCDICGVSGMGTVISSDQMRKAVRNGFNPFKLRLVIGLLSPEEHFNYWKNTVVLQDTSDWNICDKCMGHVRKYLNETPQPKNINHSYSYPQFNNPQSAEVVRKLNDTGITDTIEKIKQKQSFVASKPVQPTNPKNQTSVSRYKPQRTKIDTLVKSVRVRVSTDKYGFLGIGIAFIVSIFPVIGAIVGGFIGGFLSNKTLNGVIGAVIGSIVFMELFTYNAESTFDAPLWFMILFFIVIFAVISVIPSYVGRVAGRKYFRRDDKTKNDITNVPKHQSSVNTNKLIICPKCKTENVKEASFCAECGKNLKTFRTENIVKDTKRSNVKSNSQNKFEKKKDNDKVNENNIRLEAEKKVYGDFKGNNSTSEDFYMIVSNKYTAYGYLLAEGQIEHGVLNIGDTVYIYDKEGNCKYKNKSVVILTSKELDVDKIKHGDEAVAIAFDGLRNFGDIDYNDIISKKELNITPKTKKSESVKKLPTPKTYNDPDKSTHINMATNDLASIFSNVALGGNLTQEQGHWIKNVGEDLYNAHGFDAMQEVFINVKNRYPSVTSLFSKLWDGVGGWAD